MTTTSVKDERVRGAIMKCSRCKSRVGRTTRYCSMCGTPSSTNVSSAEDGFINKALSNLGISKEKFFDVGYLRDAIGMLSYARQEVVLSIAAQDTESHSTEWAELVLRMYSRFFQEANCLTSMVDGIRTEDHGIKFIVLKVGNTADLGFLASETGIHSCGRITTTESGERHCTSFAAVKVVHENDINSTDLIGSSIDWSNRVRHYSLDPVPLVKDFRTGYAHDNPENVLDGNIEPFIRAYLNLMNQKERESRRQHDTKRST